MARETLDVVLSQGTEEAALAAKVAFLQAIAGQVYPTDVVPELFAYLKVNGFRVGDPFARS